MLLHVCIDDIIAYFAYVYRVHSISRRSLIVAAPPDVLKEIVVALEY